MRVRIKTYILATFGQLTPGMVVEVSDELANLWIKKGLAMKDMSVEPSEHK
ncbi:MAG: hypothetical protein P3T54_00180 [Dehalogenimonas sp.]|nr:hypothetical protein [Dehalogenimonas sp.]